MDTIKVSDYLAMQNKQGKKKNHPEHDEQVALFIWAELNTSKIPALELLMAIPNGASYGGGGGRWNIAKKMKEEGVRRGVPDVFLPVPMTYTSNGEVTDLSAGLWIEMKAKKGRVSPEQSWWMNKLEEYGYKTKVCYSCEEAIECIQDYLDINSKNE